MLYALFVLFVVLMILDGVSTYRAISRDEAKEGNPLMAYLFDRFGVMKTLVVVKAAAIAVVWLTMGPYSVWVLVTLDAFYTFVVWNNYRVAR